MFFRNCLLALLLNLGFNLPGQKLIPIKLLEFKGPEYSAFIGHSSYVNVLSDKTYLINGLELQIYDTLKLIKVISLEKLLNKTLRNIIDPEYGFSYYLNANDLIIQNKNNIFIFSRKEYDFHFKEHVTIQNIYKQEVLFCSESSIYSYGVSNVHPKSLQTNFPAGYVSINTEKKEEKKHEVAFKDIVLSHFSPNHFIEINSNGYAVCDPFDYKIRIYDFRNNLMDTIVARDSIFTRSQDIQVFNNNFKPDVVAENPSSYFSEMDKFLLHNDRIWSINYLNKNTLFVRITRNSLNKPGDEFELFYDHIWQKLNNKWNLIQVVNHNTVYLTELVEKTKIWPLFVPGSKLIFNEEGMFYFVWNCTDSSFPQKTKQFYWPKSNENAKPKLKLVKFQLKE